MVVLNKQKRASSGLPIEVRSATKMFANGRGVSDISFEVERGSVVLLAGRNGAGKTTIMRSMLELDELDRGEAYFRGVRFSELDFPLASIGIAFADVQYDELLTPRQLLMHLAPLAKADSSVVRSILSDVGLLDVANERMADFSLGMKKRVAIAAAVLGSPDILMLDEPFIGLDPIGTRWLKDWITGFVGAGGAALISSHDLNDMEDISDAVVLIENGDVIFSGSDEDFLTGSGEDSFQDAFYWWVERGSSSCS